MKTWAIALVGAVMLAGCESALIDRSEPGDLGILTADETLSMFDPYDMPCSELSVKFHELTCRSGPDGDVDTPCPATAFVGTDMFASFTE